MSLAPSFCGNYQGRKSFDNNFMFIKLNSARKIAAVLKSGALNCSFLYVYLSLYIYILLHELTGFISR